jgi:hypothetical protein
MIPKGCFRFKPTLLDMQFSIGVRKVDIAVLLQQLKSSPGGKVFNLGVVQLGSQQFADLRTIGVSHQCPARSNSSDPGHADASTGVGKPFQPKAFLEAVTEMLNLAVAINTFAWGSYGLERLKQ